MIFRFPPLYGLYDASHADDVDTRRSTMAYVFLYYSCVICWKTKLHTYVTLSTNNSEYCCSAKAAREAVSLRKIFFALNLHSAVDPIALFNDNQGALAMTVNPVQHEANKHCDTVDHYVRELVAMKWITTSFTPYSELLADALTKFLPPAQCEKLFKKLMADAPLP